MSKDKISDYSATANSNTDIGGINIDEGCAPSGINDAIRTLMKQLKDFQQGTNSDPFNGPTNGAHNGTVGATTPAAGAFTTLSASGQVTSTVSTGTAPLVIASTTKVANLNVDQLDGADWASPAAIGSVTPAAGTFTSVTSSGDITINNGNADGGQLLLASSGYSNWALDNFSGRLRAYYGSTEYFTINTSGNVGIGTSSPTGSRLDVLANSSGSLFGAIRMADASTDATSKVGRIYARPYTNANADWSVIAGRSTSTDNTVEIGGNTGVVNAATTIQFYTAANNNTLNGTERARIDSSGNLLVSKTADTDSVAGTVITLVDAGGAGKHGKIKVTNTVGTGQYILQGLNASGSTVGGVTTTSTATAFNTSSDYRLKENIQPMVGALEKVAALKPCTYTWKLDGSDGQGFIAHELQEVVPDCVTGEKDAVDADGNPVYQGIDTSFLVATLTAAIQELAAASVEQQALITQLQADVAALKGQ